MRASVITEGGEVDVSVDTTVASLRDGASAGWLISGETRFADAVFPELPGWESAFFTDKEAFLDLEDVGSSELDVSGRAGWDGDETSTESVHKTVVAFPVYDPVLE